MDEYRIAIALWDGVEELDFAGPYEVLTAWSRMSERSISVRTASVAGQAVTCAHGLTVVPDTSLDELGEVDLFLMPGGDVRPLVADPSFVSRVRGVADDGALMASVCTGAFVFATAGLLEGRRATTHWSSYDQLEELGVTVDRDARFVDEGPVVTAAGVSAGIDMALHLVARLESDEMSSRVRRYIQYEPAPVGV
jgi:transcriptional regulator GlxA family with amidase domain